MTNDARHTVRWLVPSFLLMVLLGCASDTTTPIGLSIQEPPSGLVVTQNQAVSGMVLQVNGGAPGASYYWNFSGQLPPGVTASPADGNTASSTFTLSGTPSTVGTFSFTIALDGPAPSHQQLLIANFSFRVQGSSGGPLQILTKRVYWPSGISGFEQALSASGGSGSGLYTWSATLPPNLSLNEGGVISGQANGPLDVNVAVTVRDSGGEVLQDTIRLRVLTIADFQGTWSGVITTGSASIGVGSVDVTGQRLGLLFDSAGVITSGALHATTVNRNQFAGADIRFTFDTPYLGRFNGQIPQFLWHASCRPVGDPDLQLDCIMHYSDISRYATLTLSRINPTTQDTTAPTLSSSIPASGATDVTSSQMTLTFSEPMSSGSAVLLSSPGSVNAVTFSTDGTTAVLSFSGLTDFRDYTLTLNPAGQTGFLDLAGNPLAQRVITFRTGALSNNQPPVAQAQSVNAVHGQQRTITLSGTDPDNNLPLTYAIVTPPTNGTLSAVTGASVVYTSNVTYTGPDSFTFTVTDSLSGVSQPAQVTITVTNQTPVATAQSVSTVTTTPLNIVLAGTDGDGDLLTYTVTDLPNNGTLDGSGSNRTYTANNGFLGSDSLQFTVTDTAGVVSAAATVTITVRNSNQAPTAGPQPTVNAVHDRTTAITLVASDPDGDLLTYTYSDPPFGALSGTAPNLFYTPNTGYVGADSFTFSVRDPLNLSSSIVTVNITVTNQPPTAGPQPPVTVVHDRPIAIPLVRNDADGDLLTFTVSDPPNGTLSGTAPNLSYTSNAGFVGSDSFTFSVRDTANATSNPATVTITVTNQAPTAAAQSVSVTANTPRVITLAGNDPDGDPLTFAIAANPSNGSLSAVTGASVTYTPATGYLGADSFTFTVRDTANVLSAPATVSIMVGGADAAPVAVSSGYPYTNPVLGDRIPRRDYTARIFEVRFAIPLSGSDAEGPVTFELVQYAPYPAPDPTQGPGQVSIRDGTIPINMVQGESYIFWNPSLLTWEYRAATYSSTVDPSTGVITVSQPGAQAFIIYTTVTCHFWEDISDTFTFRVRDSIGQVSSPAIITVWHKTGSCSHPPS